MARETHAAAPISPAISLPSLTVSLSLSLSLFSLQDKITEDQQAGKTRNKPALVSVYYTTCDSVLVILSFVYHRF